MNIPPIGTGYDEDEVIETIAAAIESYYEALIAKVQSIKIDDVLGSKNPYLYRVKNLQDSSEIVTSIIQAFISSSEETIFGNQFFEPLAIVASGGKKSTSEGVDIEIDEGRIRTVIAVKSGTSVFNADSKKRQLENFNKANKLAIQGGLTLQKVIGFAYGSKQKSVNNGVIELAGEDFWEYITGDKDFYKKIIVYMGDKPAKYSEQFNDSVVKATNRILVDFGAKFVAADGSVDWDAIVEYNSGSPSRKEAEEFERLKARIVETISDNPDITKEPLKKAVGCGSSKLKKALDELIGEGKLKPGCKGKRYGWTVVED